MNILSNIDVTNIVDAGTGFRIAGAATSGQYLRGNGTNFVSSTIQTGDLSGSFTGITGVGTLTAGTWNANAIQLQYGGTGNNLDSVTAWSSLIVDAGNKMSAIAPNTTTTRKYWGMTGTGAAGQAPTWTQITASTDITGTLPIANGGTNATSQWESGGAYGITYFNGTSITSSDDIRRLGVGYIGLSESSPSVVALRIIGDSTGSHIYTAAGDLSVYTNAGGASLALSGASHLYLQASGSTVFDCTRVTGVNYLAFFGATPAAKQSHIADPSGGSTVDSEARTAINSILSALETYGLLATS